jgi:hypothetical protein
MIAGHTRTLRDVDPLPPAIKIGRRVHPAADLSHHGSSHLTSYALSRLRKDCLIVGDTGNQY